MSGDQAPVVLDRYDWMRQTLSLEGLVAIPDAHLLPLEAANERQALAAIGARALIALPMLKNKVIVGFVGYSAPNAMPEWSRDICEILTVLGDVIAGAMGRQRAESALRESEARLSFLVSTSPVTIYTRETQEPCPFTYVSPNMQALMGLEPTEFLELPAFWLDRIHPDDRRVLAPLSSLGDGAVHQREYRLLNKDGEYRWVQDQLRLAHDGGSGEPKLVGYWMDITERKRIEGELHRFNQELEQRVSEQTQHVIESERFARATLDALDARVAILDDVGNILAVNRAWLESQTGRPHTSGMMEGQNYLRSCDNLCGIGGPGTDGPRPIAAGIQAVIQGTSDDYFLEYACPLATEPRWFVCRVKRFAGDSAVRVVVSHEDITVMKLVERQQMRSQRLESLGTLAGGVAHDLNNSLAPILMGMGILQDQFPQEQKLISMIHNSAKRGADMVRQLITFAKGVDGQRVTVYPDHLVRELESLMKGSFPKNIELQIHTERSLPAVLGDATQLHQILLNLCVNARDAMPHGGTLTVQAKTIELDASQVQSMNGVAPGRYVRLCVSDTGDGIRPDILDRIFDPFFTTKSQDKGTGLGLSTVLGIVKGHKGNIQVSSSLGKGATFTVDLPVSQVELLPSGASDNSKPFQGQGESILFVDDEPAVQQVGKAVLERLNFKVIVAVDGEDGLIKATENRATLKAIITDMHMPHMDGLAFVHAVRRTLPDIPIILSSGRVDDAVARDFRALGVKARLDKPFSEAQLAEKLHALLSEPAEHD
jgi:PAS domain S-box-containing protein